MEKGGGVENIGREYDGGWAKELCSSISHDEETVDFSMYGFDLFEVFIVR